MNVMLYVRLADNPSIYDFKGHPTVPRTGEVVWAKLGDAKTEQAYRVRAVEHYLRGSGAEIVILVDPISD